MTCLPGTPPGLRARALAAAAAAAIAAFTPAPAQEPAAPSPAPPDAVPVTPRPVGPVVEDTYRVMLRPALWLAFLDTSFRKSPGADTVSIEDTFEASRFQVVVPLDVLVRTENKEFRFRYMFWNESATNLLTADFGDAVFTSESVEATLDTDVFGADFLQRIVDHRAFDLYISTGADLFSTRMDLRGAAVGESVNETVPVITVGLGLRMRLKDELNLYFASSALSYSQLLGMDEEFFGVNDTFRNVELSLQWDRSDSSSWGVAWRHYEVGFQSARLSASQELKGVAAWFSCRF